MLGLTSNIFSFINGLKVAKYLNHVHGNPPKVGWFLDKLSKHGKISGYIGYATAIVDGINIWKKIGDFAKGLYTGLFDLGEMVIALKLGGLIGGLIGGPAGAIIATFAAIGIEALIQIFKKDVVNWLDEKVDSIFGWISEGWSELVNA